LAIAVMQARAQGESAVPAMALALAPAAEAELEEASEDTAMFLLEAAEFLMLCGALALCGEDSGRRRWRRRRAKKRIDIIAVGSSFLCGGRWEK
jgi:hypothetical protein